MEEEIIIIPLMEAIIIILFALQIEIKIIIITNMVQIVMMLIHMALKSENYNNNNPYGPPKGNYNNDLLARGQANNNPYGPPNNKKIIISVEISMII